MTEWWEALPITAAVALNLQAQAPTDLSARAPTPHTLTLGPYWPVSPCPPASPPPHTPPTPPHPPSPEHNNPWNIHTQACAPPPSPHRRLLRHSPDLCVPAPGAAPVATAAGLLRVPSLREHAPRPQQHEQLCSLRPVWGQGASHHHVTAHQSCESSYLHSSPVMLIIIPS